MLTTQNLHVSTYTTSPQRERQARSMLRPVMNCALPTYPKPPEWAHKITLLIAYDINLELIRKFPRKLIQCV